MADFARLLRRNRNAADDKASQERFKEILQILKDHDVRDGITPEKAVEILQDLGSTFVKLGQVASTHADLLPPEYCDAFAALRSEVRPMDAETVHAQIERKLGLPASEILAEFDDEPLGSASIGQVHKATLFDGTVVAVKVRRPGVVETVTRDFALLERLVKMGDIVGVGEDGMSLKEIVEELEHTSKEELDFTNEARNLERFYRNNVDREGVKSPRVYLDYTNEAILVEDFVGGPTVGDQANLDTLEAEERLRLADLLADNYAAQVLVDGFYHADPHAGNVLLVDGGIEWIDFGMMGTMTSKERQSITDLVTAIVKRDSYALKRCVLQVAKPRGAIDHGALLDMCETVVDQYVDTDLESFDTGKLMDDLLNSMQDNDMEVEPFLTNLARGLVTVEGTLKMLSPDVNIMECFSRHVNFGLDPESIERKVQALVMNGVQGVENLAGLPTKAVETLDMLQKSQLKVGGDFGVDPKSLQQIRKMVSNLLLTLMATALFTGSCILCLTGLEPEVLGVPALGFFGFVMGFALMVYVFVNMSKE